MAFAKVPSLLSLTLGALYGGALAGGNDQVGRRQAPAEQGAHACQTPGWIPACPDVFSCMPPGGICCSNGMTFVMPPKPGSCAEETDAPTPTGPDSGHSSDGGSLIDDTDPHECSAPAPTAPPQPLEPDGPGCDAADFELVNEGSNNWLTFAMTLRFSSQYYSLVGTSSVLLSTELTSCTTVSVSATNEAQASQFLSSYTPTAAFAAPTETRTYRPSADVVGSFAPVGPVLPPTATGRWRHGNGTVTRLPAPVFTARAVTLGGFGGSMAVMVAVVLGAVALL